MNWLRLFMVLCIFWAPLVCHRGQSALAAGTPTIVFDSVPAFNSFDDLKGRALNVTPADYKIAVFIYVSSWWTKPYFDESLRLTPISANGTWICDITTGGSDQTATRIAAYLLPTGYMPPIVSGYANLPAEISQHAVASLEVTRTDPVAARVIDFSGLKWTVKRSETPVGPPDVGNYFSESIQDVWVDSDGRLHLRISNHDGRWYCSEVVCNNSFGYGTYRFILDSDPAAIDKNAVLGMFTWDDTAPSPYREIDIEFSRWGTVGDPNSQYVLQPWDQPNHRYRFNLAPQSGASTHSLTWRSSSIAFTSTSGNTQLAAWTYTGSGIPTPGAENTRINLWLVGGSTVPPSNNATVEVIVRRFEYVSDLQTSVILNPTINLWKGSITNRQFVIKITGTGLSKEYMATGQSDGTIPLGVLPRQAMTVEISARPFLKRKIQINPSGGELIVPIILVSGDADNNGLVNLFDYVELDSFFNSSNNMADLDGTGSVNLFDYVVLDQNFGAQGD